MHMFEDNGVKSGKGGFIQWTCTLLLAVDGGRVGVSLRNSVNRH